MDSVAEKFGPKMMHQIDTVNQKGVMLVHSFYSHVDIEISGRKRAAFVLTYRVLSRKSRVKMYSSFEAISVFGMVAYCEKS